MRFTVTSKMVYGIYGVDTRRKPCPFCGGKELVQEELITEGVVRCKSCNATVFHKDGLEEAIKLWDERFDFSKIGATYEQ